jgi:hypothetical protein
MNRLLVPALLLGCCFPSWSSAMDIKNIRKCYGPLGATRLDNKCLPGDLFFMTYDIEDLALDKTGKASISTTFEFIDPQDKVIFTKATPKDVVPQLGGARVPGDVHVILGPKQAPGKYKIKVIIEDKVSKQRKAFEQPIEVLAPTFGFVGAISPAVGLSGQPIGHVTSFGLVNLTLDGKQQPNATLKIRILDAAGKDVTPATEFEFPKDLPEDTDLQKGNFVPITFPVFLNRPGRYTIDVQANDKHGKKTATLNFPLRVLEVGDVISGK